MAYAAQRIGLVVSTAGSNRPMLPNPWASRRRHRDACGRMVAAVTCVAALCLASPEFITTTSGLWATAGLTQQCALELRDRPPILPERQLVDALSHLSNRTTTTNDQTIGHALLSRPKSRPKSPQHGTPREEPVAAGWNTRRPVKRWLNLAIDSGATWHVHHRAHDLVNLRACADSVVDAAGKTHRCESMGDMPVLMRGSDGAEYQFLLRGVRLAPQFPDTLISVDQLWTTSRADCVFRDRKHIIFELNRTSQGTPLTVPFKHSNGLYLWRVAILDESTQLEPDTRAKGGCVKQLKRGIHAARSTAHLSALPGDVLADILHRRLHVSSNCIRRLGDITADAPAHVASSTHARCSHCTAANASRLPHGAAIYEPSHTGRLVHVDIAGPFRPSSEGGYRYAMILVDDHARFKFLYPLHKRSDGPSALRKFIAEFNALASENSDMPIQVIGQIRTDNAGEFTSREFEELLDQASIRHVTSPPYVHQLNGVAERSIRSVFNLVRSYLAASGLPAEYWLHAAEMAVDVLNRTTGPTVQSGGRTSHELVTGRPPKILHIMPFGCRAFAVKPREQYSKTTLDPRAWVGINLGRSRRSPQAYKIWCPSTGRVVVTSDVYFMEHLFPMRPRGLQTDDEVAAVPTRSPYADNPEDSDASNGRVCTSAQPNSNCSRRVLLLFSGPYARPDGLAAMLRRRGADVTTVDNDPDKGDAAHDILSDAHFINILEAARRGDYGAVLAAPPCSTYSVARYFTPRNGRAGAKPVRSREHILGLPNLSPMQAREVQRANEITRRTCAILSAARASGAEYAMENPADRGDPSQPHLFHFAEHGPIWLDPNVSGLRRAHHLRAATFAQCMIGGDSQKYTTLWYTPGMSTLDHLRGMWCKHPLGAHKHPAGGHYDSASGTWNSAHAAAYPADLNALLADALIDSLVAKEMFKTDPPGPQPTPTTEPPVVLPRLGVRADVDFPPPLMNDADLQSSPPAEVGEVGVEPQETPSDPLSPTGPKRRPYRRKGPDEHFHRALGPHGTRSATGAAMQSRTMVGEPVNHAQAMRLDAAGWTEAEVSEIANHEGKQSWVYIPRADLPPGRRVIRLTWAYKVKRTGKYKARLCVQGCSQVPGVDFDQTYCAAMRAGSLRTLCAVAARLSLQMFRWDFVAAYLQGELESGEVVYCSTPPGYSTASVNGEVRLVRAGEGDGVERLCKVIRPVYGMAQAGRRWQRTLFPWLLGWRNGGAQLSQSTLDTCVFHCTQTVKTPDGERLEHLFVGCYVDDLFILASHTDEWSLYRRFTTDLSDRGDVEDEGPVADLLSIEIDRTDNGVCLRQSAYIQTLLDTYAPEGKPTSMCVSLKLSSQPAARPPCGPDLPQHVADALVQTADEVDKALLKEYQSLVCALLYCAVNTRPDVAYAVGMLCRAMGKPTVTLLEDAYRVLFYLHHHRHVGLHYAACELDLRGVSDADWATQYSTSGYVFHYAQAAISWSSKRQPCVALSSCEAEIVALSEAAKEGVYLSRFLSDLGLPSADTVALATDNSAARDLAYNPEHHERTKHIERRHFFVRDMVENHMLVVPYVASSDNMADFFTKPLSAADFYRHRRAIMNLPPRSESTADRAGGC